MGTSKGYVAPTSAEWGTLKGTVTRLARQSSISSTEAKEVLGQYVSALGGARASARSSGLAGGSGAQDVARRVADFINAVSQQGLAESYQKAGLGELAGKATEEVVHSILDYLGGPGSTFDEVDGRHAEILLMAELLEGADTILDVEARLAALAMPSELATLLTKFFGFYIFEQFNRVYYERLVQRIGAAKAERFLGQIKDFIREELRSQTFDLDITKVDWSGEQGKQIATEIFERTLHVFGG